MLLLCSIWRLPYWDFGGEPDQHTFGRSVIHAFYAASGGTFSTISHHFLVTITPTIPIVGVTKTKRLVEDTATPSGSKATTAPSRRSQHHPSAGTHFLCCFQPQLKSLTVHLAHSLLVPLLLRRLLWFLS